MITILILNNFKAKCNNKEFKELSFLKKVHKSLIMEGCRLTSDMLDSRGNRENGWEVNGKRGDGDIILRKMDGKDLDLKFLINMMVEIMIG